MIFPDNQFEDFLRSIIGTHTDLFTALRGSSSIEGGRLSSKLSTEELGVGGGLAGNRMIAQMAWSTPSTN